MGRYATILMAGAVAEWLLFQKRPLGAEGDAELLTSYIARARPSWTEGRRRAFQRRALLRAHIILHRHMNALRHLTALMMQGGELSACLKAVDARC